jgi:hypothetical protein
MNIIDKFVRLNPNNEISNDVPNSIIGKVGDIIHSIGKVRVDFSNGYFNFYDFDNLIIEENPPIQEICITEQYLFEV